MKDFIADPRADLEVKINSLDLNSVFVVLRTILNPLDYYIIYVTFMRGEERGIQTKIANTLGVTRKNISTRHVKALENCKKYIDSNGGVTIAAEIILQQYVENNMTISNLRDTPIAPADIFRYFYIKDDLTLQEQRLLYFRLFGVLKSNLANAARELKCSEDEIKRIDKSIELKMERKCADKKLYEEFCSVLRSNFQACIYFLILNPAYDFSFNLEDGELKCSLYILNSAQNTIGQSEKSFRHSVLVSKELGYGDYVITGSKKEIEIDVYLTAFGMKSKNMLPKTIPLDRVLWGVKREITEEEYLFLDGFVIKGNESSKQKFMKLFPNSKLPTNHRYLIRKLEIKCYGIKKDFYSTRECLRHVFQHLSPLKIIGGDDFKMVIPSDIPFWGDICAINYFWNSVCNCVSDDGATYLKIKRDVETRFNVSDIESLLESFILSAYRLQGGIARFNGITPEDIAIYMAQHPEHSGQTVQGNCGPVSDMYNPDFVDDTIVYGILKNINPEYFNLDTITKSEVEKILANYGEDLEPTTYKYLAARFRKNGQSAIGIDTIKKYIKRVSAKASRASKASKGVL